MRGVTGRMSAQIAVGASLVLVGCFVGLAASVSPVDRLEPLTLGGIEQWIRIQVNDTSRPILLVLHGGPGYAMMHWVEHYGGEVHAQRSSDGITTRILDSPVYSRDRLQVRTG